MAMAIYVFITVEIALAINGEGIFESTWDRNNIGVNGHQRNSCLKKPTSKGYLYDHYGI